MEPAPRPDAKVDVEEVLDCQSASEHDPDGASEHDDDIDLVRDFAPEHDNDNDSGLSEAESEKDMVDEGEEGAVVTDCVAIREIATDLAASGGNHASQHTDLWAIIAGNDSGNKDVEAARIQATRILTLYEHHQDLPGSPDCWFCWPVIRGASSICIGCSATICPAHRHSASGLCIGTERQGLSSCHSESQGSDWIDLSEGKLARVLQWRHHLDLDL